MPRSRHAWHVPGRLYDLAFGLMLRGVRRRIAGAVAARGHGPWLDLCSGSGLQFRGDRFQFGAVFRVGLDKDFAMLRYAAARAPGASYVCGDAGRLPFKDGSIGAVTIAFGIHEKDPELRREMMRDVRRVLAPAGRLVAADFENPWNKKSRAGALFARAIERLAGGAHYRNGREFLRRGGLRSFLEVSGFEEEARHGVETGALGVVVARPG